jgi:Sec7-like guanine-nucleotide exchange factor
MVWRRSFLSEYGTNFRSDQPYILAFSMIMLHTDAFNKHNRNKMTKADYVKNTRLPGISSEILEVRL